MPLETACQFCSRIKFGSKSNIRFEFGRHDRYPEFPELTQSAIDGCEVCGLFKDGIKQSFQRQEPLLKPAVLKWDGCFTISVLTFVWENDVLNDSIDESLDGPFRMLLFLEGPQLRLRQVSFDMFAESGSAAAIQGKIQRVLPSADASSDVSIQLIKSWLHDCDEHHPTCCRTVTPPKLPTRVIDVSGHVPRLVVTGGDSGEYIALSHCWGDAKTSEPPLTTKTASFSSRLQCIEIHDMPRNFQDAIIITRKLGLRYIWIDSLCIIQDMPSDWETEAARMGDVYKNSCLTVVATSAISSHDGFLNRSTYTQHPVKVSYNPEGNFSPNGYFYLCLTDTHWAENSFDKYIEGSAWNQRGWTFQERLLPKRVLHFAKDIFCLECRSRDYTEDNRPALASQNRTPWLEDDGPRLQREEFLALSREDRLYRRWYWLVERYATRDFTYTKDKLPAIAGLAREMSIWLGDIYLAGLWRNDLNRGLLWNTVDYGQIKLRNDRAPSWSWAHFDGHLNWNRDADRESKEHICGFTLLGFTTGKGSIDQMPHICDRLKISGKLMDVSAVLLRRSTGLTNTHDIMLQDVKIGEGSLDLKDTSYTTSGLRAFLVHYRIFATSQGSYRFPNGLLLETTQTSLSEYKRVGTFSFTRFDSGGQRKNARIDLFDHCLTEIFTLL